MQFLLLLMQYMPLITGLVQTAETVGNAMATKATGAQKLKAVTDAVVATAPAIGALVQASPEKSNHLQDYISGTVQVMNSLNAWAAQQSAPSA